MLIREKKNFTVYNQINFLLDANLQPVSLLTADSPTTKSYWETPKFPSL